MAVQDLITKWEEALAEAQLPGNLVQELDDAILGSAAVPGVVARSGLMAAGRDPCADAFNTDYVTCLITC
jgi:hypothetical protein